jgi:acetyltransferase-like isoleucine patch superfamily enzyme
VKIAPQCGFYTALHPLDAQLRATGAETAKPIRVGNNVWFGGGVKVLPGVTIGDNCVIGAGSVVTHDIPANSLAYGNPCKVVRELKAGE